MEQRVTSGTYKTISYKLLNGGNTVVVILPRAGARLLTHEQLIHSLNKSRSVLFLESGYFGMSRAEQDLENFKMDAFRENLHSLIIKLGYKKVILIGESVGAIHALNYANYYKNDVGLVVLSNPALYKSKWLYRMLVLSVLNLGIKTSPNMWLEGTGKLLKSIPTNESKKFGEIFMNMSKTIGARSYLACLKEIADFYHIYETDGVKSILNKCVVLKGKSDKVFDLFCDKKFCKACLNYIEVPSAGHGVIDVNPGAVVSVLN